MTPLQFTDPVPLQPNATQEPLIPTALDAIKTWANGNIDKSNLAANAGICKLPTLTNSVMNVGHNSISFTQDQNVSLAGGCGASLPAIHHGLGVVPIAVVVTPFAGSMLDQLFTLTAGNFSPDGLTFDVFGYRQVNQSGTLFFYWFAFG